MKIFFCRFFRFTMLRLDFRQMRENVSEHENFPSMIFSFESVFVQSEQMWAKVLNCEKHLVSLVHIFHWIFGRERKMSVWEWKIKWNIFSDEWENSLCHAILISFFSFFYYFCFRINSNLGVVTHFIFFSTLAPKHNETEKKISETY